MLFGCRQNPMGEERVQWRRTLLAAMANYIDAGSIVAGAVSLPIWAAYFGFGDSFVSFLGAFSSNAIAAGLEKGVLFGVNAQTCRQRLSARRPGRVVAARAPAGCTVCEIPRRAVVPRADDAVGAHEHAADLSAHAV